MFNIIIEFICVVVMVEFHLFSKTENSFENS